jgi:hypothetical protein
MFKFCPKCNTEACDETSFFCYSCGSRLPAIIQEKKSGRFQDDITTPEKESTVKPDISHPPESISNHQIKMVELCAQCGEPINDTYRIFCKNCAINIKEVMSGEMISTMNPSHLESSVQTKDASQNPTFRINVQEPVLLEGTSSRKESILSYQKADGSELSTKKIFLYAGIVIIFFVFLLLFLLSLLSSSLDTILAF